jgi:hypothetical protein
MRRSKWRISLTTAISNINTKTKHRVFSSRANYTDRETAACLRSKCQIFVYRGCRVVSAADPYGRILGFLDRNTYFSLQVAPQLYSRG